MELPICWWIEWKTSPISCRKSATVPGISDDVSRNGLVSVHSFQNDGSSGSAVAVANLQWGKQKVAARGNLADIMQELDTDHASAAQRPISHQGLLWVHTAKI